MSCFRTQCSDEGELKPTTPQFKVKHSSTEPLHSLMVPDVMCFTKWWNGDYVVHFRVHVLITSRRNIEFRVKSTSV